MKNGGVVKNHLIHQEGGDAGKEKDQQRGIELAEIPMIAVDIQAVRDRQKGIEGPNPILTTEAGEEIA